MPLNRNNEDADSPSVNATSQTITTAQGSNTHGTLNQHPDAQSVTLARMHTAGLGPGAAGKSGRIPFRVGVSEDRNKRWRRTMEDAHAFVYDFGGVKGQGFFSVFDGHAGKHAAEWCGKHFHEYLLDQLRSSPEIPIPDLFNTTFHEVDNKLSQLAQDEGTSSGCTAVTAFLRLEDEEGRPVGGSGGIVADENSATVGIGGAAAATGAGAGEDDADAGADGRDGSPHPAPTKGSTGGGTGGGLLSGLARRMRKGGSGDDDNGGGAGNGNDGDQPQGAGANVDGGGDGDAAHVAGADAGAMGATENTQTRVTKDGLVDVQGKEVRRVLYTANVGDARAVLCRAGKAVRLTYDHKGSDAQEAKRITDAGGFVMNNRVNGVLAVTRSLGDSSMKEFVVGSPYTTETALTDDDSFLIVACDGLWDVTEDQDAVDLIQNVTDPQEASDLLLQHALSNFSTDNTSVMVVRFALTGEVNSASAAAAGAGAGASAAAGQRPPAQGETERDGSKSAPSLGPAKGATNEAGATLA